MMPQIKSNAAAAAPFEQDVSEERPIDLVHLARYTMDDRDLEREVLNLFRKQSVLYLDRLRKAESAADWSEAAHTLKGSARGIGAWAVARAAQAAEMLDGPVKARSSDNAVHELAECIFQANEFIHRVVAEG